MHVNKKFLNCVVYYVMEYEYDLIIFQVYVGRVEALKAPKLTLLLTNLRYFYNKLG